MGFAAGQPIKGAKIDVAFVGSCANGRLSGLRIAAEVAKKGKGAGTEATAGKLPNLSSARPAHSWQCTSSAIRMI